MVGLEEKDEYTEIIERDEPESKRKAEENGEQHEEVPEAVITEEFAKKHGLPHTFIGRPFDELGKSYNEIKKFDTKLSQQNKSLSKAVEDIQVRFGNLEKQLSAKEVKDIKQEVADKVEDQMPEMPDPYDKPEEFKKWMAQFAKNVQKQTREELLKTIDEKNQVLQESVQKMQVEKMQETLYDSVTSGLQSLYGDEVDSDLIERVIAEYEEYLKENPEFEKGYGGKPKLLARDIVWFHKNNAEIPAKKADKGDDEEKTKKAVEEAHKKQVEKLNNTTKKYTQSASSARNSDKGNDDEYAQIIREKESELS